MPIYGLYSTTYNPDFRIKIISVHIIITLNQNSQTENSTLKVIQTTMKFQLYE